jgi:hypothetical protein
MTVIGTASHAARYSTARFLSDDFASMAATDRVRTSCRGCRASARTPRSSSRIPKRRRAGRPWRVRPMPCYVEGGGCSNLWAAFGADRWSWFIRKKLELNTKSHLWSARHMEECLSNAVRSDSFYGNSKHISDAALGLDHTRRARVAFELASRLRQPILQRSGRRCCRLGAAKRF